MVSNTRSLRGKLVTIMSDNKMCCRGFRLGYTWPMITCTNPKLTVAHELEYRVVRSSGAADGENELRAKRETRRIELSSRMWWVPIQPSSIGTHDGREAQMWYDGGDTVEMSQQR